MQETFGFSRLHQLVLGLIHGDLETSLRQRSTQCEIDILDRDGRTPLSWAANIGDTDALRTLLKYGADPEFPNNEGVTPIHFAASRSLSCTLQLIAAGVNVNQPAGLMDLSPVHYAALFAHNDSPTIIDALIKAGASMHHLSRNKQYPLTWAIVKRQYNIGKYLLDQNVDLRHTNHEGNNVLNLSIVYKTPDFTKLLFTRGIDYAHANKAGQTILHQVASHGDIETVKFLTENHLRGLDPNATDLQGRTAMRLLQKRAMIPEGFTMAFRLLLNQLQNAWDGDVFEDALENQENEEAASGTF